MTTQYIPRFPNKTPRMVRTDAYTASSLDFESADAVEYSEYYLTFRRHPKELDPSLYQDGDLRMIFSGMQHIIERLFLDPVTHEELERAEEFYRSRKYKSDGSLADFEFAKPLWLRIINEFGGRIPIQIDAMPEGSTVYPGEPVIRVRNTVPGFGPMAAWFEPHLVQAWSCSERATAARHWLEYNRGMIRRLEPKLTKDEVDFFASTMMHDFGARAAAVPQENEFVAMQHLYCFSGTDTMEASYRAWQAGAPSHIGGSIWALAHRIVQGFVKEGDCYETLYNQAENNSLLSFVGDCYDFERAVRDHLLPLAKRSEEEQNGKVVVARPDSGDPLAHIMFVVGTAWENGLFEKLPNGMVGMTSLRFIQGDSMNFNTMRMINDHLIDNGFLPHRCGIYGVGGHLRNSISRDNLSTKYALFGVGSPTRPVIKLSHTEGKRTLPLCVVTRDYESVQSGVTIKDPSEGFKDAMQTYYCGTADDPFPPGPMYDNFTAVQSRILEDFSVMPMIGGEVSDRLEETRDKIAKQYG